MQRLLQLGALLVVATGATATAPRAQAPTLTIEVTAVEARPSSAAIAWRASAPVRVVAEHGLTDEHGVWTKVTRAPGTAGRLLLAGLEPRTAYRFRLVARAGDRRAEATGSLTTLPIPAWSTATTTASALFLDWQPFFPRMVWKQCPWAYGPSLAAGVNLFMGTGCGDVQAQLAALSGRAFSVLDLAHGVDGRGVVGYHHQDEVDEHVTTAEAVPRPSHSRESRRVTFLTLTNHFFSGSAPLPHGRGIYPELVARAEMVGFDLYPLQIWCRRRTLQAVYDSQRELVALARGKPTYQWIEAGPMNQCAGLDPSPHVVRAETWLAIAGGARGIGWFPSEWRPEVGAEIARLSREIASLAPALLGPEIPVTVAPASGPVRAGARRHNGATYVIAVNSWLARVGAAITVPGLAARSVRVLGEGRTLPVRGGRIADRFRGLAVHVYVAPPGGD